MQLTAKNRRGGPPVLQRPARKQLQNARIVELPEVRKRLGGVTDAVIGKLMTCHGMPWPTELKQISRGQLIRSYVWNRAEWERWHQSQQSWLSDMKKGGWTGNAKVLTGYAEPDYRQITRDWIHSEARKHGRVLTHEITIGFREPGNPFHDPAWVSRRNDDDVPVIRALAKKLATKVWRRFFGVDYAPRDIFLFCIYPERHSKHGGECRWHFHVELFLDEYEGRLLKVAMPRIRQRIQAYLNKYANGREVDVAMQAVDSGFAGYAQKDARHNIDLIECNFLNRAIGQS